MISVGKISSMGLLSLCSYRIKMDEIGAQESGMDFYAQFNSLKALEKNF